MSALLQAAVLHPGGYLEVWPEQVFAHLGQVRLIDVREPHEFLGEHIPGAELVPLPMVARAAAEWRQDEELVLVCRSGQRSERAARALLDLGFHHIMNMVGGMRAWVAARLPVGS
jgi:rhodanese-related sulfurtransferase